MAIYLIQDRWTRRELAAIDAPSYARALERAARSGMTLAEVDLVAIDLRGAFLAGADFRGSDLTSADLSGCYLRGADLRGACLAHAFLGSADLRHSDLREADLSRADLRSTSLVGADLRGTILTGARLEGTLCDWRWSAIPAELLRRQDGDLAGGSRLVVALAFHDDPGPWSWLKLIAGHDLLTDWALGVLAGWVRDGDNDPICCDTWRPMPRPGDPRLDAPRIESANSARSPTPRLGPLRTSQTNFNTLIIYIPYKGLPAVIPTTRAGSTAFDDPGSP